MQKYKSILRKYKDLFIINAVISTVIFVLGIIIFTQTNFPALISAPVSSIIPGIRLSRAEISNVSSLDSDEKRITEVVKSSNPAVVSIVISETSRQGVQMEVGGGTGFLVSSNGLIVTNRHVVDDAAAKYSVFTYDGKRYPAIVVAKDPVQDVAVIKISGSNFPHLFFGDSDNLELGQTVIAIGNVFDQFKNSVSVGVVSGLSRSIVAGDPLGNSESLDNVIQTDAAINPGNSGGPLLDTNSRVIGVNVAIARGSENVGFALPSNTVNIAVDSVIRTGRILRPYLGVRYIVINEIVKDEMKLPVDYGVLVQGDGGGARAVAASSPAEKAGIEEGDIILSVNDIRLTPDKTLATIFQTKKPGDVVNLTVLHNGQLRQVKIILAEFPN